MSFRLSNIINFANSKRHPLLYVRIIVFCIKKRLVNSNIIDSIMANYSQLCEQCFFRLTSCERFYREFVEQCDDFRDIDTDFESPLGTISSDSKANTSLENAPSTTTKEESIKELESAPEEDNDDSKKAISGISSFIIILFFSLKFLRKNGIITFNIFDYYYIILIIALAIIFIILGWKILNKKNRGWGYFVLLLCLPPIGLIVAYSLKDHSYKIPSNDITKYI